MTASIIEYCDGTSFVIVTGQDGEHHVLDIIETDSRDGLGHIEYETFRHDVIFNYSLLGDPNAEAEEISDVYDCEDEYA